MINEMTKTLEALAAAHRRLASQERDLISTLNRVLAGIGYQVIARGASSERPRAARKTAAVRGRRKPLACPHCDRRFAQPVHLGRHVSATHKGEPKMVGLKVVKAKGRGTTAETAASAPPAKTSEGKARKVARTVKPSATKVAI